MVTILGDRSMMRGLEITFDSVSKSYGTHVAVRDVTATIRPGAITGFLGPNGAGKSTTMRILLGIDKPSSGSALVGGRPMSALDAPGRTVGAMLNASAVHPRRTARDHLAWVAAANGLPRSSISPALERVGLADSGHVRASRLSLGMRQRLGLAAALLGDPSVLVLDEPLNGLDPEGIVWLRDALRAFAADGGNVLLSSHLMNEMQATADRVIVLHRGVLVADMAASDFSARTTGAIRAASPDVHRLRERLERAGGTTRAVRDRPDAIDITELDTHTVGVQALEAGVPLTELWTHEGTLESAFLELTATGESR
ncbi:ABC transporter ATP-binding protein [Microbacterium sp. MPKO10]|uniref:ABC transporter ATP-binding protein n=1 Tax=Microbacterium sp. MPKO10 TaxID=2989818 RepID=UPI0022360890|nr:ATP-binding cassette domain-containing protein [Microbacterium sp. MPKO10]MCW4458990.1 ATP-binding cassette domain-containing protein [Microbacterium sp. MPKO10]